MDGFNITSGAQVFDVAFGVGVVSSVKATRCTVKFPSGAVSIYDLDGNSLTFGRRTLFWADPLVGIKPPSPNAPFQLARATAHAALDKSLDEVATAWPR
jgi:hypothetical protein